MTAIPPAPHLSDNERDLIMDKFYPRLNAVIAGAGPVDSNYIENARKRSRMADDIGTLDDKRNFKLHLHIVEHQSMGHPAVPVDEAPLWAVDLATLQGLPQRLARIERQVLIISNSSAILAEHRLAEIPNNNGVLPSVAIPIIWFPTTRGQLYSASNARLVILINFYGIDVINNANVESKRKAVSEFIGIRL